MRGDASTIKERLSITEVVTPYLKLEKTGANFKARCPFHNEKSASFFISPSRQSYYCFGCGAKGDIFTFIEEMEGTDFRGALKILAEKAGVELEAYHGESKTLKDSLHETLDDATAYFEGELKVYPAALTYLAERGISDESIEKWKIGYAPDEWRELYSHLTARGTNKETLLSAGLIKQGDDKSREPYDVFRGRIIFPLFDAFGKVIAFSGRTLDKDAQPKYLNSPDTPLFTKSEVLYGFDKAKEDIRKKNYAVLVEGQMDLVLSHQAGVQNTVASSGTAFTINHLDRLKKLSPRIILAFDGDDAGQKASFKSAVLGLSLAMEVKIAKILPGKDPADLVKSDPEVWKEVLRSSTHAIEFFLDVILDREKDKRKIGKAVEQQLLPMVSLLQSSIERGHFLSLISKKTGIREEVLWEDLRTAKPIKDLSFADDGKAPLQTKEKVPRKTYIERRLAGILFWQEKEVEKQIDVSLLRQNVFNRVSSDYGEILLNSLRNDEDVLIFEAESYFTDKESLQKDIKELLDNLEDDTLREKLSGFIVELSNAEREKNEKEIRRLTDEVSLIHRSMKALEESRKMR